MEIKEIIADKQDAVSIKLGVPAPTEAELIDKNIKETFDNIYQTLSKIKSDINDLNERCNNLKFLLDRR